MMSWDNSIEKMPVSFNQIPNELFLIDCNFFIFKCIWKTIHKQLKTSGE